MKKSKILMAAIAAVLALTMLAGCGGGSATIANENEDVLKLEGTLASAEPLTLTIHMHFWNNYIFDDEWPIYKEAAKKTNITLHGTASKTSTDSNQEFNTMLVNDVLPDIIHGESGNLNKAGRDGALIPLQDLVKKYAPHIQAKFDEVPEAYNATIAADGNLYYIPVIRDDRGPTMGWFIRQDWLDKLNLPVPTTLDEYYNTLKAFREQDPNGNGIKDEVPYFDRAKSVDKLIPLWGARYGSYFIDSNGKVVANKTTDEYKTAMKELSKWYKEGLIDQEIFSRNSAREELFGNNLGGATCDWFSSTMSFNKIEADKVKGFHIAVIPPVKDVNGDRKNHFSRAPVQGIGWGISKDNKYPAETMKYFDFWFTDEGSLLNAMGVEGEDYTIVNGEPKYTDKALTYENGGAPNYVRTLGCAEIGYYAALAPEIAGMTDEAAEGFKMYAESDWAVKPFPSLSTTDDEQRTIKDKGGAVETYTSEWMQNWIMGNKDVDATWDEYISGLNGLGLQEVVAAYQTAYDRAYKK